MSGTDNALVLLLVVAYGCGVLCVAGYWADNYGHLKRRPLATALASFATGAIVTLTGWLMLTGTW